MRTFWTRVLVGAVAASLVLGCTDDGDGGRIALPDDLVLAALTPFDGCADYLAHVQEHALELVTPYGLGGGGWFGPVADGAEREMDDSDAAPTAAAEVPASEGPVEGVDFSGTNVQEAGVDEPDMVKTDGRTLYVVYAGRLRILDVTADEPREIGNLDLGDVWDAQLLLDGDRLLVTTSGVPGMRPLNAGDAISSPIGGWSGTTVVSLVDVSDPSSPEVTERLTLDGYNLSSRMVDGVARLVIRSEPVNLPFVFPQGGGLRAERTALETNQQVIRDSSADDWIPYFVHEVAGGRTTEGSVLRCNRIARPAAFSGLGTVTVLTVDLAAGGLRPGGEATAVLAGGETVYASAQRLYVATTRWIDWEALNDRTRERMADELTTEIHSFDISNPRRADYLASGQVEGSLLSQWAMSEHEGHLRVASTVGDDWWWGGGRRPSESFVTVLAQDGDELVEVGKVGGLGLTERIYAVRFIGDAGYVVTFRQVDPLYTIDLSDPTDPVVEGELKILGYSAYLHPVGEDLLLGVGQDADDEGMLKGTQLSLFDVSDPTDPRRIDQLTLGQGSSDVEYDHRAFLHWRPTGLTVVPFSRWDFFPMEPGQLPDKPTSGAYAFTATAEDGISERGIVTHQQLMQPLTDPGRELAEWELEDLWWEWSWQARIVRSIVVGDRLLTVSDAGVAAHDLDSLEPLGWAAFGR